MQIKYIDLFAGVGGFHLGIKKVFPDWECVYSNEWDKYANSVYRKHFGECDQSDIRTVTDIPDHDLLCGGFPCQAFSVAGKRGGFDDTRGTLFFEIARILRDKRPRHFLLENVKGLLSHDAGKTFQTILGVLSDIGYGVQWQVLNSKDFGVPQNRERVFIVGHLRGTSRPQVFPFGDTDQTDNGDRGNIKVLARGGLQKNAARMEEQSPALTEAMGQGGGHTPIIQQLNNPTHSNDRVYGEDGLSPTLNTMQGGRRQPFVAAVLTPGRPEKRQNGRRMKDNGEPSFTLTSQDIHGVAIANTIDANYYKGINTNPGHASSTRGILDGARIRRLTPTECEALQGFPRDWTKYGHDGKEISDTQRYKMMGNAVTTNVITAIITKMYASGTPTE